MEPWSWSLILKPLAVVLIAAAYYFLVIKGSQTIGRFIPDGKLKDFLFRERGTGRPQQPTGPAEKVLDNPPLVGTDTRKDGPGLRRIGHDGGER